jgi:glycosyltransferase involved in cell wall biosynthesis
MPKVSIIIPSYCSSEWSESSNRKRIRYLTQAVRSAQAQVLGGYRDFEIIVVDDGSDLDFDEIWSRLPTFWGVKPEVYQISHSGRSHARNCGFDKSTGEYTLFLDSDDILHHKYLYRTYDLLDFIPEAHYVWTDFWAWRPPFRKYCHCGGWNFEDLKKRMCFGIPSLVRASSFVAVGKFDIRLDVAEDHDLFLRLTELGLSDKSLNYLPEPLWYYRRHTENTNWPTHTPYLRLWRDLVVENWQTRYKGVNWNKFQEKLKMAEGYCKDCVVNDCELFKKKRLMCCQDCPNKCEKFNCPVFDRGLNEEEGDGTSGIHKRHPGDS